MSYCIVLFFFYIKLGATLATQIVGIVLALSCTSMSARPRYCYGKYICLHKLVSVFIILLTTF